MNMFGQQAERKHRLDNILRFIRSYVIPSESNSMKNAAVFSVVKIYADKINLNQNEEVITCGGSLNDFKRRPLGSFYEDHKKRIRTDSDFTVSLSQDPVITNVWNDKRLALSLNKISPPEELFCQDKSNHAFRLFLPMGLTEVFNGNHSANSGILKGTGTLRYVSSDKLDERKGEIYDLSHLYNDYYYDGCFFRKRANNRFSVYGSFESGCIFEIGRVIYEEEISFLSVIKDRNRREELNM